MFGLHIRPERGFKFFWRSPGKFGLRPTARFEDSLNVARADLLWPTPRRIPAGPDGAIGYDRETVPPIRVRPEKVSSGLTLRVDFHYGICGEVCLPGRV